MSSAEAAAALSASTADDLPLEVRRTIRWIRSLPVALCALVDDIEQVAAPTLAGHAHGSGEPLIRAIAQHVMRAMTPDVEFASDETTPLDESLHYLLAHADRMTVAKTANAADAPAPPPAHDLAAFSASVEEGDVVSVWRLLQWLQHLHGRALDMRSVAADTPRGTVRRKAAEEEARRMAAAVPHASSASSRGRSRSVKKQRAVGGIAPASRCGVQVTYEPVHAAAAALASARSRTSSRSRASPSPSRLPGSPSQPPMHFGVQTRGRSPRGISPHTFRRNESDENGSTSHGLRASHDESVLLHRGVNSPIARARIAQATQGAMQAPPNDAIIAARSRGRAQALHDVAVLRSGMARPRSASSAAKHGPVRALHSVTAAAAAASSGAVAAQSTPAPPAPQVPSPTYSNPHSSFKADVYALNQNSTPKSTNQQQQQEEEQQKQQMQKQQHKQEHKHQQEQEQEQEQKQKQKQEQPPHPQPQSHALAPPPRPNSPRPSARKASPSSRARTRPPSSTRPASPVIPASLPAPPWPRVVDDALLLFKWLQSLQLKCINDRVSAPRALLSPQECAQLPSEFRSQLGLAQAGAASDIVRPPSPFAFADGHLLCAIVSKLQRSPLSGAVRPPSTGQSQTTRRAVSLHNVELAIDALRNHQRMPLTYLYREPAIAIVQQDAATLRALLLDIRTAFPASWRRPTLMQMQVQT